MRTSAFDHPAWLLEVGAAPSVAALLAAALLFPDDRLLVGTLLGLVGGLLVGVGVTLAVTRWAVTQARRTTPAGRLLDEPIEDEWREISL